jgi:hypothetical protein
MPRDRPRARAIKTTWRGAGSAANVPDRIAISVEYFYYFAQLRLLPVCIKLRQFEFIVREGRVLAQEEEKRSRDRLRNQVFQTN